MPDLDEVVRGLMKDIGSVLRPQGFRGSAGRWRLSTAEGVAVIEKQGSRGSVWHTKEFFVNTAVVPNTWWEWHAGASRPIGGAREYDGIRLLEGRVKSDNPDHAEGLDRWQVTARTDMDEFRADLLAAVSAAASRLIELLEPGRYLDELRALPDKKIGHWQALVVLLPDRGLSPELTAALEGMRAASADRPHSGRYVDRLAEWARTRAAQMTARRQ